MIKRVCVYCSSSDKIDKAYQVSAYKLGEILAENSIDLVYGGGSAGSMGQIARGALSKNGKVYGIIPEFMYDLEWGFEEITELKLVKTMHERKKLLIEGTDAAIALPGGTGTFEEVFEALTMKRLGDYLNPIIFVNTNNYFAPCVELLENSVKENFMDPRHRDLWTVVNSESDVLEAIENAPTWSKEAINFATSRESRVLK